MNYVKSGNEGYSMYSFDSKWSIYVSTFNILLQAGQHLGLIRSQIIKELDLSANLLSSPINRISVSKYFELFEYIEQQTGNADIGLFAGKIAHANGHNLQTYMTTICQTFRDYLQLVPSILSFSGDIGEAKINGDEQYLQVEWHPLLKETNQSRYFIDSFLVISRGIVDNCCIKPINVIKADFSYSKPQDTSLLESYFGQNLRFNCDVSCIYIERESLNYPMCQLEYNLSNRFIGQLAQLFNGENQDQFITHIHHSILKLLPKGNVNIVDVATDLNISKRTLQRRLTERNTQFAQVLQQVRKELSKRYIADKRLNLIEVAFLLGYAEQSSFSSAFKSWHGVSPGKYRESKF